MKNEIKNLFKTKKGILVFITIIYAMVMPYLTIMTLKYPNFANGWIDFGTLCLSFIPMLFGDILAECFGWKKATVIASVVYAIQLVFIGVLHLTTLDKGLCIGFGDIAEDATFGYNILFSAQWRITLASAIGYYTGIFTNSAIMGLMKARRQDNDNTAWFFFRCILSTVIGQLLDNGLFFLLAMAPVGIDASSELPWDLLFANIGIATALEVGYEIILFPLTKLITKKVNTLQEA